MPRYAIIDRDFYGHQPSLAYVVSDLQSACDLAAGNDNGISEIWSLKNGWRSVVKLDENDAPTSDGTARSDERAYLRIVPFLATKMETIDNRETANG
jgi:hypothetical protein